MWIRCWWVTREEKNIDLSSTYIASTAGCGVASVSSSRLSPYYSECPITQNNQASCRTLHIIKHYSVPKCICQNPLASDSISIHASVSQKIVSFYKLYNRALHSPDNKIQAKHRTRTQNQLQSISRLATISKMYKSPYGIILISWLLVSQQEQLPESVSDTLLAQEYIFLFRIHVPPVATSN